MRNLNSDNEEDALLELRADEILIPSGGITVMGYQINFFSAGNDEDFMPKEVKLNHRRSLRKQKYDRKMR